MLTPEVILNNTFENVENRFLTGRISHDEWDAYRWLWHHSAPRFGDLRGDISLTKAQQKIANDLLDDRKVRARVGSRFVALMTGLEPFKVDISDIVLGVDKVATDHVPLVESLKVVESVGSSGEAFVSELFTALNLENGDQQLYRRGRKVTVWRLVESGQS